MKKHRKTDLRRRNVSTREPAEKEERDEAGPGRARTPDNVGVCPQEEAFLWGNRLPDDGEED